LLSAERRRERRTQLLTRTVQPRTDRRRRQLAGPGYLFVGKASDFAQQEYVPIELGQRRERLAQRRGELLCRGPGRIDRLRQSVPAIVADMIQREVSSDSKDPRATARIVDSRDRTASDPQEYLLRQVAGRIAVAEKPAQVSEDPITMSGEQHVGIGHRVQLSPI